MSKKRKIYTKEECIKLYSNCKNRTEFKAKHKGAWMQCLENNWQDDVCPSFYDWERPTLEALYDIVQEDSPAWNTRWKIKSCYKIKFDEVKTNIGVMLEPKPECVEKEKRNEEIRKYNTKQHKKCQKWRDSNLKFYKKMLKIISN